MAMHAWAETRLQALERPSLGLQVGAHWVAVVGWALGVGQQGVGMWAGVGVAWMGLQLWAWG